MVMMCAHKFEKGHEHHWCETCGNRMTWHCDCCYLNIECHWTAPVVAVLTERGKDHGESGC